MQAWRAIPVAIGGVVAIGFVDEDRVVVGSQSGVGVFDVQTGERVDRMHDEDYNWYQGDSPAIRYSTAAGLWGGDLDQSTTDGWTCHRFDGGTVLSAESEPNLRIEDSEEYRAQGFSPAGWAFVYATSPTVHLVSRRA